MAAFLGGEKKLEGKEGDEEMEAWILGVTLSQLSDLGEVSYLSLGLFPTYKKSIVDSSCVGWYMFSLFSLHYYWLVFSVIIRLTSSRTESVFYP